MYWSPRPRRRQSISLLTVKVSPPSMMRGAGGRAGVGHRACVMAGFSLETWNVGCTRLMVDGSLSRTAVGLMMRAMVIRGGTNFLVPPRMTMSLVESHTRCPTRYIGTGVRLLSACIFMQSAALMRLARVTLHVLLQRWMNARAEGTPTPSSWLGKSRGW